MLFGGAGRATAVRTTIGQHLKSSPARLATAVAVAVVAVGVDFALVWWDHYLESVEVRGALAVAALAAQVRLANGDLTSVGLRLTPAQGWWYWGRASLLIGLVVLVCLAAGWGAMALSGWPLPVPATPPSDMFPAFLHMCVFAPVHEETIYRLALCLPLAVLLRPWGAVAVSGMLFGALHWLYGNPSPENQLGGFLLAWAYLKSESIAVPVVLHGLGNLCALAAQVVVWYWLHGGL